MNWKECTKCGKTVNVEDLVFLKNLDGRGDKAGYYCRPCMRQMGYFIFKDKGDE